jgi:hypothetical protein
MAPNEIRDHLRAQPFQPFRVYLSDGASYQVLDPTYAYVTMSRLEIATEFGQDEIPTRSVYCDPRHVTRIEPINGAPKGK